MMEVSLRVRLTAALLGTCGLVWIAATLGTYRDARAGIGRLLDAHLAQAARLLTVQSGHELTELIQDEPRELSGYEQTVILQAWERGTRLILRSATAPASRLSASESGFSDVQVAGREWRVFSSWDREHDVLVQVGEDRSARDALTRRVAASAVLPVLATLPLLGLLVWFVIARGLKPLQQLGIAVSQRSAADLAPIPADRVPAEVKPLVERLNELLARIAASLQAERRFTAHAAHELRTPLAGTRAQAEVARAATGDAQRIAALDQVIQGCDRMARLVEQMLLLARLEEQTAREKLDCRLDLIAREVLAELAPGALARDVNLELRAPVAVCVAGRAELLAVLVRNLVDNAVRHGARNVVVRCLDSPSGARLEVQDDGPGVDESEIGELGRRFFRAAGTTAPGSGIGLTIVRRIAELHGASIKFGRRAPPDSGLRVELQFAPLR